MNIEVLVDEICKKVQAHLEQKPKLLVLANQHGAECHEMLESVQLKQHYQVECALTKEYDCKIADYEAVIAYGLTNEVAGKVANGILDTAYSKIFSEALLLGKRIFIPKDEVELYRYANTAAQPYYARLNENLKLLQASGAVILSSEEIPAEILKGKTSPEVMISEVCEVTESLRKLEKKVITERDIRMLRDEKVTVVQVNEKTIITDLAKEYATKQKIVIRQG